MRQELTSLLLGLVGASALAGGASAQSAADITPSKLLAQGYTLVAASSNGVTQYIYLQGVNPQGTKTVYACQLQFTPTGGPQGCLALP